MSIDIKIGKFYSGSGHVRAYRGLKNACEAVRVFLMDSNSLQFRKVIVLDPDPKQIVSTRKAVVLNSQKSKTDPNPIGSR
jgi:hypothetical protein